MTRPEPNRRLTFENGRWEIAVLVGRLPGDCEVWMPFPASPDEVRAALAQAERTYTAWLGRVDQGVGSARPVDPVRRLDA